MWHHHARPHAQGQPVAGAEVELFEADSGERAMIGIPSHFRSAAEGRFEFHAPDGALLEARHPDHQPGRARVSVDGIDGGDSILPALSSTVTDVDGRFELVGVTPGRVSVNVAAFAHDGQIVAGIELEPGQTHGPLVPGESIVAVDGVTVLDLGFENAVQNIRGQIGTTVKLELVRLDGSHAMLDVERRRIQTP